jgi:hypothetical protein
MEGTQVSLLKTENGQIPARYQSLDIGESVSNTVNVPLHYIHGGISDEFSEMAVFWFVAPCSLVEVYQRFRDPCCLHH